MPNMVLPLLRNEIAKVTRTKLPYFGLFGAFLVCLLIFFTTTALDSGGTLNAWGYVGLCMQCVFADVGLIFIAVFCAMLIAEETGFGTARMVLSSPVLRWELYTAKVLIGLLYMVVMFVTALLLSILLGSLKFQFGNIADSVGVIYGIKEVLWNFLLALFLDMLPMVALVMYGVFISAVTKRSGQAIGLVIGTIILIETAKHFINIGPYIFTTYRGFSWGIFHQIAQGVDYQWTPEIWKMIIVSLIYCFVTFTAGLTIFAKHDLNG